MSFDRYYGGLLSRRKPSTPTAEEARQDFLAIWATRLPIV